MAKAKKMRERFFRKSFPHFWLGIEQATAELIKTAEVRSTGELMNAKRE
jgi:hypothetical protein